MGKVNVTNVIWMGDDILRTGEHVHIPVPGDKEKIAKTGTKWTKAMRNIKIDLIVLKSEVNRHIADSVIRFVLGGIGSHWRQIVKVKEFSDLTNETYFLLQYSVRDERKISEDKVNLNERRRWFI